MLRQHLTQTAFDTGWIISPRQQSSASFAFIEIETSTVATFDNDVVRSELRYSTASERHTYFVLLQVCILMITSTS
jgi:hypothetical protein